MLAKVAIVYVTGGGNTGEVADLISATLTENNVAHDVFRLRDNIPHPDIKKYDKVFLGAYTIGDGRTPDTMIDFLKQSGYKDPNVHVFGTGETQWREYCGAVDRLARFHGTNNRTLKIEHSPRGSQEKLVIEWTLEAINNG